MQQADQNQSYTGERRLDEERAASMADEGGVSGAIVDAREQAQALARRKFALPTRWGRREMWALAALGAGAWLLVLGLRSR